MNYQVISSIFFRIKGTLLMYLIGLDSYIFCLCFRVLIYLEFLSLFLVGKLLCGSTGQLSFSNCYPLQDKMKYPTSSNSEKAQALAVIELGPEGPCDLEDLLTHGKMGLRGSDSQEIDLVVEPDCVDNSDDRLDNPKGINRDQQPKSQGNIKLLQDKEKSAKSGEGTVSSLGLPWHQKAVVKWGLFVFVLLMAG